jgi:mercuric reductase
MGLTGDRFDLVILGGGAAAFAAAIRADEEGFRPVLVNQGLPLGGTCVNVGCIPSKFLLEAGNEYFYRQSPQFACNLPGVARCDFPEAIANKDRMVRRLRRSNYEDVLRSRRIEAIEGHGTLLPGRRVRVGNRTLEGRHVLVATGSSPRVPPIEGLSGVGYLTNRTLMRRKDRPEELLVLGGGPMGLEFAQMYSHFGSRVSVLESGPRLLPMEEPEVSEEITRCLLHEDLTVHVGARVKRVKRERGKVLCELESAPGKVRCKADEILIATGIVPNTSGMGLEEAGVRLTRSGYIRTTPYLETSVPGVWAAGDVAGPMALETVAAKQGAAVAMNALKKGKVTLQYDLVPHAVFTNPQVASVGLTEAEALRRGRSCDCRVIDMRRLPKALTVGDTRGVLKMVTDAKTERILGVHIVSPIAADMIHAAAYALRARFTVEDVIDTVHTFPTFSEALKQAAESFRHDMSHMSCCIE